VGGEAEASGKAQGSFSLAAPFGVVVLLGILLGGFRSFRKVAIVLATIPLGILGIIPGLLLSGEPFGFMSLLGVIALAGIVVNNAIVLLDVVELRRKGDFTGNPEFQRVKTVNRKNRGASYRLIRRTPRLQR
jgi:multidrug efflux pump subunit AcrB